MVASGLNIDKAPGPDGTPSKLIVNFTRNVPRENVFPP